MRCNLIALLAASITTRFALNAPPVSKVVISATAISARRPCHRAAGLPNCSKPAILTVLSLKSASGLLDRGAVEAVAHSRPIRCIGRQFDGDPVQALLVQIMENAIQALRVGAGSGGHVGEIDAHSLAVLR